MNKRAGKQGSTNEDTTVYNPLIITMHGGSEKTLEGYKQAEEQFKNFFGAPLRSVPS
jgi:hypothetical protein